MWMLDNILGITEINPHLTDRTAEALSPVKDSDVASHL